MTFYNRNLYWCFTETKDESLRDGSRVRKVKGKWSCKDVNGNYLLNEDLSGKLTKIQGYRGTICRVKEFDYLLRKINNIKEPNNIKAEKSLVVLKEDLKPLIQSLNWKNFELFVELIFTSSGWHKSSVLSKSEKHIDLVLISPISNKTVVVQVKSESNMKEFLKYKNNFLLMSQYDELYYVVHSPDSKLANISIKGNIQLITLEKLAELTINSGLINWLLKNSL